MDDRQRNIPDRVHTFDGIGMTAYAGATWDWTQMHLDLAAAKSAGFERPVVDGQMIGALLAAHAQDAIGLRSRVIRLEFRHTQPVFRDEQIIIRGRILADDGQTITLQQDVDVLGPDGVVLRQAIIGAEASVLVRRS